MTLLHPGSETVALLSACDREGSVRIAAEGRSYLLLRSAPERPRMSAQPNFADRLAKLFPEPLTHEQTATVDRMIAGE